MSESAAGPKKKYKIQIIKAGIGDPLLAICFKFLAEEGYDNPEEYPVEGMSMTAQLEYNSTNNNSKALKTPGNAILANFATLNNYYLTFPFDQPADFNEDDPDLIMILSVPETSEGVTFDFVNGETGYMSTTLDTLAEPVPFASLSTKYTYCPGGECATLGLDG